MPNDHGSTAADGHASRVIDRRTLLAGAAGAVLGVALKWPSQAGAGLASLESLAEVRFDPPTKFRKTVRVRVAALTVPERGDLGYVYVLEDLTDIRRLEREVRMRDRLAAVGRMAAGIAHEIRNPLSSIGGSVKVLSGIDREEAESAKHPRRRILSKRATTIASI